MKRRRKKKKTVTRVPEVFLQEKRTMCIIFVFYCVFFLVSSEEVSLRTTASSISASTELCGPETEIELSKSGEASSMTVTLSPTERDSICTLRVTAPKTHVINMQFVDDVPKASINASHRPPCVMSIILPENPKIPVWKGDLCATGKMNDPDLLTADFRIIWTAPSNPMFNRRRKFSLTAVGQGQVCKEAGQHTCMRIGWDPMMCVSDTLLCDGFTNCPKSSTTSDEDEKLCKKRFFAPTSLEQLAVELFKKWKPPEFVNNKWLHDKLEQHSSTTKRTLFSWVELNRKPETTTTSSTTTRKPVNKAKATDSISQVLSKYGPWGYLMLGMLICGTVLMFCGLWECCFRKPKTEIEPPVTQTQPTTVLIIGHQEETTSPSPPNYDELDLPPSYTTLFPHLKVNQTSSDRDIEANSDENSTPSTTSDERSTLSTNSDENMQSSNSDENSAQTDNADSVEVSAQSTDSCEEASEDIQSIIVEET